MKIADMDNEHLITLRDSNLMKVEKIRDAIADNYDKIRKLNYEVRQYADELHSHKRILMHAIRFWDFKYPWRYETNAFGFNYSLNINDDGTVSINKNRISPYHEYSSIGLKTYGDAIMWLRANVPHGLFKPHGLGDESYALPTEWSCETSTLEEELEALRSTVQSLERKVHMLEVAVKDLQGCDPEVHNEALNDALSWGAQV